jgi:hypothetical protein
MEASLAAVQLLESPRNPTGLAKDKDTPNLVNPMELN